MFYGSLSFLLPSFDNQSCETVDACDTERKMARIEYSMKQKTQGFLSKVSDRIPHHMLSEVRILFFPQYGLWSL
jgi:hypothetical protein